MGDKDKLGDKMGQSVSLSSQNIGSSNGLVSRKIVYIKTI